MAPLVPAQGTPIPAQETGDPEPVPPGEKPLHQSDLNPESGPVLKLTLEDAVRIAIERNLDLEIQEENTQIARFNNLGSWGAFDPLFSMGLSYEDASSEAPSDLAGAPVLQQTSIGANGQLLVPFLSGGSAQLSYNRNNQDTNSIFATIPTSTTDVVSVGITQPLLRGAWKRYATTDQRESEARYQIQVERERQVRQDVVFQVANAYWDLVAARMQLEVQELALELGIQQLEQNENRLRVGLGTEVDVLQAQTNVAAQEQLLLGTQTTVLAAVDALRALLFQREEQQTWRVYLEEWDTSIEPLTGLLEVPVGEDADLPRWGLSLAEALEYRSELIQQRLEIDAAVVNLERAQSNRLPDLDLSITAAATGFDENNREALQKALRYNFPTYSASLDYSVPIRNRTARFAEQSARAAIRLARLAYGQIELQIVAEVRAAVRDVVYQIETVEASIKSIELAERQLAAEEARFGEGMATNFQVLEYQQQLSAALSAGADARAGYAKALTALRRAEGRLGERNPEQ